MKIITVIVSVIFSYHACGQSIISYWSNLDSLYLLYVTKNDNIEKISVTKKGYYLYGKTYFEKWVFNFSEAKITGEMNKNDEQSERFIYEFNSKYQLVKRIKEFKLNNMGWKKTTETFEYVEGKKIQEKHFDQNNNLIEIVKYEYDHKNNPIKISFLNSKGLINSYETAEYNYDNQEFFYKIYNSQGNLVSEKKYFCNFNYDIENIKNEFGDIIKVISPISPPETGNYSLIEYEYDENNNWTFRKTNSISNKHKQIASEIKRKIVYK